MERSSVLITFTKKLCVRAEKNSCMYGTFSIHGPKHLINGFTIIYYINIYNHEKNEVKNALTKV